MMLGGGNNGLLRNEKNKNRKQQQQKRTSTGTATKTKTTWLGLVLLLAYLLMTISQWRIFHKQMNNENNNNNNKQDNIIGGSDLDLSTNMKKSSSSLVSSSDQFSVNENGVITLANGNQLSIKSNPKYPMLEDIPSVDYYACCGLGHRLIRMSSAAYIARMEHFELRSFWGWCGEKISQPVEVYSHLFHPQSCKELLQQYKMGSGSTNINGYTNQTIIPFYNEVPGFRPIIRHGRGGSDEVMTTTNSDHEGGDDEDSSSSNNNKCPCHVNKIQSDYEFYSSLRKRYRDIDGRVKYYLEKYFHGNDSFVIGIHVRAGNGEIGDFERKGRNIANPTIWVSNVVDALLQFIDEQQRQPQHYDTQEETAEYVVRRPILYVATDTPSIIDLFRNEIKQRQQHQPKDSNNDSIFPLVIDLPQPERPKEGQGVLFGESAKVHNKGSVAVSGNNNSSTTDQDDVEEEDDSVVCLQNWRDTIADMILLSYSDVVIAGTPSSFSQTLPMSLAFGSPYDDGDAADDSTSTSGGSRRKKKKLPVSYCEVIPQYEEKRELQQQERNATKITELAQQVKPKLQCYKDYMDWCCNYSTWIKFTHKGPKGRTKIVSKEFVVHPVGSSSNNKEDTNEDLQSKSKRTYPTMRNRTKLCLRPRRGRIGGGLKDKCLPHEW